MEERWQDQRLRLLHLSSDGDAYFGTGITKVIFVSGNERTVTSVSRSARRTECHSLGKPGNVTCGDYDLR